MNTNNSEKDQKEMPNFEQGNDHYNDVHKIVERVRLYSISAAKFSLVGLIVSLVMIIIGVISIIKIGWLIGLFMILCGFFVGCVIFLISHVTDLTLINHSFMKLIYSQCKSYINTFDEDEEVVEDIKILDIRNTYIGRNSECPCGSGKKYKKCCANNRIT